MKHRHPGKYIAHTPKGRIVAKYKPIHKQKFMYNRLPNYIMEKDKNLTWNQIHKKYPHLNPLADTDSDGKHNYEDCRPLNNKRQDIQIISEKELEKNKEQFKIVPKVTTGEINDDIMSDVPSLRERTKEVNVPLLKGYSEDIPWRKDASKQTGRKYVTPLTKEYEKMIDDATRLTGDRRHAIDYINETLTGVGKGKLTPAQLRKITGEVIIEEF